LGKTVRNIQYEELHIFRLELSLAVEKEIKNKIMILLNDFAIVKNNQFNRLIHLFLTIIWFLADPRVKDNRRVFSINIISVGLWQIKWWYMVNEYNRFFSFFGEIKWEILWFLIVLLAYFKTRLSHVLSSILFHLSKEIFSILRALKIS